MKYITCLLLIFSISWALADTSAQAIQTLSRYRSDMGLSAVTHSDKLKQAAVGHSQYLAAVPDREILSKLTPDGVLVMGLCQKTLCNMGPAIRWKRTLA